MRFIVGNDRSGTTMLRLILDRGPDLAVPPESMFLTDFADVFDPAAGAGHRAGADGARLGAPEGRGCGSCTAPPPRRPAGLAPADAYRFVVEAPYAAYAAHAGQAVLGRQDAALRPPRRPPAAGLAATRASSCSCATGATSRCRCGGCRSARTTPGPPPSGGRAGSAPGAAPPSGTRTRCAPSATRTSPRPGRPRPATICAFLGVAYGPDMLDLEKVDRSKIVADQASWFPTSSRASRPAPIGRWRREMRERDQAHLRRPGRRRAARARLRPGPGQRDRHLAAPGALVPAARTRRCAT